MENYNKALIYCRVSSKQQVKEGHGLDSQETRCRNHAKLAGLEVVDVYRDEGVSGGLFDRPALKKLFAFLDNHPLEKFIVIIDDLSRLARDIRVHMDLRAALIAREARLVCLNFTINDESEDNETAELMMAVVSQHLRKANRRQVIQRMNARFERGYWPFAACPPGLKFTKDPIHGKLLVPDEPLASVYKQAIEKYRDYELNTLQEVRSFILRQYSAHGIERKLSLHGITSILTEPLYCGYMECRKWNLSLRRANHQGFISFETYQAVQEKLAKSAKPRLRKDSRIDFPLRNFVLCHLCKKPYTASWHRGRNKNRKYAHYWCKTRDCQFRNKAVDGVVMEEKFQELLRAMKPAGPVLQLAEMILKRVWLARQESEGEKKTAIRKEVKDAQARIEVFMDRIAVTKTAGLAEQYEKEVESLAAKKSALEADLNRHDYSSDQFGTAAVAVFDYLKDPENQWRTAAFSKKRIFLGMYFGRGILYNRNSGFGTPELPVVIATISRKLVSKSNQVELAGIAPASKSYHKRYLQV